MSKILAALGLVGQSLAKVPDVYGNYISLQQEVMEVLDENRRLADEVRALKAQLQTKRSVRYADRRLWAAGPDGTEEGPLCSSCWEVRGQLVHLHEYRGVQGEGWLCPGCDLHVIDDAPPPPRPPTVHRSPWPYSGGAP
jgi:hypothetical protein